MSSMTTEEAGRIIQEHKRRYLANHAEEAIQSLYDPERVQGLNLEIEAMLRVHKVEDLRHPDGMACYYCYGPHSLGREYARRFGPNPHMLSKHRADA